ncbi:hypothetical protein FKW77_010280 [Venturia effusa]|uniref:RRM domain-containing protein n=1 Tax=Venturia effusa TaxID=50376 RepID=A0A517KXM6_9PEZI|nr:hypothetical protein FKW77_010280 [Venturia effusa]
MAFNDNDELDLSYMDDNPNDTNGHSTMKSEPEDNVDFYDDDFDPNGNAEQSMADASVVDTNNEEPKDEITGEVKPAAENHFENADQAPQDSNGSRKRKERDDDDESPQTQTPSVSQTLQPPASTAMQQTPSFGQTATQALDIKQLPIDVTEETIREWANTVGVENDIEELKFDEHKQNGKSKGACYVRFKTPAAAQAVKNYITSLPPLQGKPAYTAYYCAQNPYHHRSGKDNYSNNGAGVGGGGYSRGGHQGRGNFGGQGYQARGNFQQRGNFNNYNRGGGYQQGFQGGRGGQQGGYGVQGAGFQPNGNFGSSFPNNGMMQQNNNFGRGNMNFRGGGRGGMVGAMGANNMARGGMNASPMGMPQMAGRGVMPMAGMQNFGMNPMMQAMMQQGGMGMGMPNAGAAGMGRGGFNPMGMMGAMQQGRGGFQQGGGGVAQGGQMGGHMQKKTRYQ